MASSFPSNSSSMVKHAGLTCYHNTTRKPISKPKTRKHTTFPHRCQETIEKPLKKRHLTWVPQHHSTKWQSELKTGKSTLAPLQKLRHPTWMPENLNRAIHYCPASNKCLKHAFWNHFSLSFKPKLYTSFQNSYAYLKWLLFAKLSPKPHRQNNHTT